MAVAVAEQGERMSSPTLGSFYLAQYDVDYTANHHQHIKDVPGIQDITLNMASCTARTRAQKKQEMEIWQVGDYSRNEEGL